jgi:peptidoglycan/LPS O-acetylase OafA/YrhL
MGAFRLLLALSVVIIHLKGVHGFSPLGGPVAVETFFMISGFYMAMILNEKYLGKGSYRLFISNRLLRIYPIYWVVLVASLLANLWYYHETGNGPIALFLASGASVRALLASSDLLILGQDLVCFLTCDPHGHLHIVKAFWDTPFPIWRGLLIAPAWSLSIELVFYALAPLIVRRSVRFIAVLTAASLCLRVFFFVGLHKHFDPWSYRFAPFEMAFFLAGALAYRLYRRIKSPPKYFVPLAVGFFAACIGYQFIPIPFSPHGAIIKQWAFYPIAWAVIPVLFSLTKKSVWDTYIGELSYPIYIIHWPVLTVLPSLLDHFGLTREHEFLVILTTMGLSVLVTWLVAMPLERLRQRRVQRERPVQPAPNRLMMAA